MQSMDLAMSQNPTACEPYVDRPTPRGPKSPRHAAQIQIQNRRREYLTRHSSYFKSLEHEFADPVLYERLVKRFQTPLERESEGKTKGYGRTLEADLLRGESKLSDLRCNNGNENVPDGGSFQDAGLELSWERPASSKEDGFCLWHAFLEDRFIKGKDEDFDYTPIDKNEDLDVLVRKDAEDAWFDEEEPCWIAEDDSGRRRIESASRQGETGIQDF